MYIHYSPSSEQMILLFFQEDRLPMLGDYINKTLRLGICADVNAIFWSCLGHEQWCLNEKADVMKQMAYHLVAVYAT